MGEGGEVSTDGLLRWFEQVLGPGGGRVGREELATLLAPLGWDVDFPQEAATTGDVRVVGGERLVVVRYDGSPFAVRRRPHHRLPEGLVVVELVHRGDGVLRGAGVVREVGPGDAVLHASGGRHALEWRSPSTRTYVVLVSRLLARGDVVLRLEDLHRRRDPLVPAVERLVDVLLGEQRLPSVTALAVAQAVHGLLSATVAQAVDREPAPADAVPLERVREVLLRRYTDPTLDAGAVARELRVSRRYLFTLFDGSPETFASMLRTIRLDHAAEVLGADGAGVTVRRVARESGFAGPAQLSRAFRERFGVTPTEFRRATTGARTPAAS
ncbi:AraC family transcriptional regulator [Cellulomonas telluris]|uniref:AraC family transcriptional regulator n=1 Tax=Cellulomonas telluris TaxID=2306636 RepID=UPI0010A817C9|nr:AraC family transcriptional regulator [Cellulomonas telluris]